MAGGKHVGGRAASRIGWLGLIALCACSSGDDASSAVMAAGGGSTAGGGAAAGAAAMSSGAGGLATGTGTGAADAGGVDVSAVDAGNTRGSLDAGRRDARVGDGGGGDARAGAGAGGDARCVDDTFPDAAIWELLGGPPGCLCSSHTDCLDDEICFTAGGVLDQARCTRLPVGCVRKLEDCSCWGAALCPGQAERCQTGPFVANCDPHSGT